MKQSQPGVGGQALQPVGAQTSQVQESLGAVRPSLGKTSLDMGPITASSVTCSPAPAGGRWSSADLDPGAVASIRRAGRKRVCISSTGGRLLSGPEPRSGRHHRSPGACRRRARHSFGTGAHHQARRHLLVNVPRLKPGSLLNRFRHRLGSRTPGTAISGRAIAWTA